MIFYELLRGFGGATFMNPDVSKHKPEPDYLRDLIKQSGLSQRATAKRLGLGYSTLRDYLNSGHPSECPYTVQYCLEALAKNST